MLQLHCCCSVFRFYDAESCDSAIAVSHDDGHIENSDYIPGSPEYIALMQGLSQHPTRLDPPPLDSTTQRLSFVWMALKRRVNLLLGRPGTPNAATLSLMLMALRSKAESHLSTSVTTVGITFANAALASRKEVNDALRYAGLKPLDEWQVPDRELNAAYGAYGFGLCPSYRDPYKCEEEEEAFDSGDSVLHIDFTERTLAANTALISTARSTYAISKFNDWELGRNGATQWATEVEYWNAVGARIRNLIREARKPYTQLLLTGDCANDEKFLEVVRDVLSGSGVADQVKSSQTQMNLMFVASRGAAEFQRRRQRGWLNCLQPKHCSRDIDQGKAGDKGEQAPEL